MIYIYIYNYLKGGRTYESANKPNYHHIRLTNIVYIIGYNITTRHNRGFTIA